MHVSCLPHNEAITLHSKVNLIKTCFYTKNTSRDKDETLDPAECSETLKIIQFVHVSWITVRSFQGFSWLSEGGHAWHCGLYTPDKPSALLLLGTLHLHAADWTRPLKRVVLIFLKILQQSSLTVMHHMKEISYCHYITFHILKLFCFSVIKKYSVYYFWQNYLYLLYCVHV